MPEGCIKSQDNIYQIAELIRGLRNMRNNNQRDPGDDPYLHSGNYFAIVTCDKEKNYFIQFVTDESANRLHIEVSSVHQDKDKLSKYKVDWLIRQGWSLPTKNNLNYSKKLYIYTDKDLFLAAAEIVTTFIMVFDLNPADPLCVEIDEAAMEPGIEKLSITKKVKIFLKTFLSSLSENIKV